MTQFPFSYPTLSDPISGRSGGILQRARDAGVCPKVLHLDTESDLWQARSSLVVTDTSGADITMPDEVRVYTVSGVPHAPFRPLTRPVMQLPGNRLAYGAFMRALLVGLFEWVEHGIAPPDSRFPSRTEGTLVPLAEARATFPRLPQVNFPNVLNELRLRDHSVEPPIESTAYPVFVQSTDADGNALGGIRHPLLTAPLATHVGWSLRASGDGEGDLFTIQGSMIPFAATEAERQRAGDPRPSLETRYAARDAWAARLAAATNHLVTERLLLAEDGDRLLERRASRGTCTRRYRSQHAKPLGPATRCTRGVLSTFHFQAPGFYVKQGWGVAVRIDCEPPGHTRFYMTKKPLLFLQME